MKAPDHAPLNYRPDIDGLRAVAVIAVMGFHYFPEQLPGGFIGVDAFFVISGYLISGILLWDLQNSSSSLIDFYARRARRIFPSLLVVLIATLAFGWFVLFPAEYARLLLHVAAGSLFGSNFLLWSEAGYFDATAYEKPLLHLWSLGIEEQFYLFWPGTLVLIHRFWPGRKGPAVGALAAISFVTGLGWMTNHPVTAFYLPVSRLWELLVGALLVLRDESLQTLPRGIRSALSFAGVSLLLAGCGSLSSAVAFPGWRALIPTVGAALVIAAGPEAWPNRTLLSNRVAVLIGLVSYPLYLWHWPLLVLARLRFNSTFETPGRLALVALSLVAAGITYRVIELPLRNRPLRPVSLKLAGALGSLALLCLALVRSEARVPAFGARSSSSAEFQTCASLYRLPPTTPRTYCQESRHGLKPTMIVVGDSHAIALWPGIAAAHPTENVVLIGGSGCPFLRQTRYWPIPDEREVCPGLIEAAYRAFPDPPRVFVLAARMTVYLEGTRFDPVEGDIPIANFDSPAFPGQKGYSFFKAAPRRDLEFLTRRGDRVDLLLQVPELDFNPRACGGPLRSGVLPPPADCAVERRLVEARQYWYRRFVREVANDLRSPRLRVLDSLDSLCDGDKCFARRDDTLLYADNNHLNEAGASWLWSKLNRR